MDSSHKKKKLNFKPVNTYNNCSLASIGPLMLPIYLLTAAKGQPTLVELKSGETINGVLVEVDTLMNVTLKEVIETSSNGESFLKLPEIFIRGKDIKYIRLPDEIIGEVKARNQQNQDQRQRRNNNANNNNNNDRRNNNNRNYNNQGNRNHTGNGGRNNQNQGLNRGARRNQDRQSNQQSHQQQASQQQQ